MNFRNVIIFITFVAKSIFEISKKFGNLPDLSYMKKKTYKKTI